MQPGLLLLNRDDKSKHFANNARESISTWRIQ
jgi:hypothetical protein